EIMPVLRGEIGGVLGHFDDGETVLRFVNSARAKALAWQGTSCPDHFVRTKVRPLFVDWNPAQGDAASLIAAIRQGMAAYREDYARYYEAHKRPDSPAMRSPNPTVVLVPGVGMFSFGRSKPEARITGEFYVNAIHVIEGATALDDLPAQPGLPADRVVDNYVALPPEEAFNIEYWQLEEAKLKRLSPEKELSRKVAVVIGASPGIGQAVAERLAREGAHVVVADIHAELAQQAAESLQKAFGKEVVAAETVDSTDREAVRRMLDAVVMRYGGLDILVQVAATFFPPDPQTGRITEEQWRKTFDVNLLASMLAADEAQKVMAAQGTEGSIVLISTGNAALHQLIRELAVEFAPRVRVNGVAAASVVEGSLQYPRERVMSSLAKYNLPFDGSETTEALRDKLSSFYAERTLLKRKVTPPDVAEAIFLLASRR